MVSSYHDTFIAKRDAAIAALERLVLVAQGHSGQCKIVAAFLAALYNSNRFPLRPYELRGLDRELRDDVLTVMQLDMQGYAEVHRYFKDGSRLWETAIIDRWELERVTIERASYALESYLERGLHKDDHRLAREIRALRERLQD